MIHVRDLTKTYADLRRGQFVALAGLSLDARPGQIYGLLGPNGAGKTTALRILSTVLRPTSGEATVNGYDVVTQPDLVRYQIGFVSCNTAVYDRMTAWEMVGYFGRLYGLSEELLEQRMEDIFKRLNMQEIRDVLGAKMSTGMKQKVSIARAIVHDPPVLIFDEATAGLDVLVARALLKTVAELRENGKCVIFSTHIMREAERLCDRIAIMHRGDILSEGSLPELRERMEDLFTRLKMNDIRDLLGSKMSTGMKQKVSIARAIVHDPPVLIFDEATAGLDVLVARALLNTVSDLRDQGKCVIFSTHIMREAEKLCDQIAIMHRGHILAAGSLGELCDQHEQHDLEELFFRLISEREQLLAMSK